MLHSVPTVQDWQHAWLGPFKRGQGTQSPEYLKPSVWGATTHPQPKRTKTCAKCSGSYW